MNVLARVSSFLSPKDCNPITLSNLEKTTVIDILRKTFKLKELQEVARLSKSICFYQRTALSQPDKYELVK